MRALLDVNVLIALLDADHIHHEVARRWLRDNIDEGWATCPLTENGCVRVMAEPTYPNRVPAHLVAERLRRATATEHHRFWPDAVSLLRPGVVDWAQQIGPGEIADIYLLALAAAHNGRYVTFEARFDLRAVPGATVWSYCLI